MKPWQIVLAALLASIALALVSTAFQPGWVAEQTKEELERAAKWIGAARADQLYDLASETIDPLFPSNQTHRTEAPEDVPIHLPQDMGEFRDVFVRAAFRMLVMGYILMLSIPFLVAVIVDGVVVRLKKNEMYQSENPRVYHLAKNALLAIIIGPMIIAVLPLALGPPLALVWLALAMFTAWGMAQNVEREV